MAPGQCVQSSVHVKFVTNSEPEPGCEHWARSPIQQKCRRGEERRGEERRGEQRRGEERRGEEGEQKLFLTI